MKNYGKVATLRDIANRLGISANTVSKALNNKGGVSRETIEKINEAARELHYIPNVVAKSLRLSNTRTIGVIVSDSSHNVFARVIKGIEEKASEMGYSTILCNTNQDYEKEKKAVRLLASKRIDGIILAATMLTGAEDIDYLRSFDMPFVFLMRRSECYDVDYVINDNISGAYMMTDHLINNGCKRIHFMNLPENRAVGNDRMDGFKKAFREHGIEPDMSIVSHVEPFQEDGYNEMKKLLDSGERVEAVFCGCDLIAVGAMEAILEKGLKIPEDIRVVGYDDIDLAANLRVPLTTVSQPKYEIGSKGAEMLIGKIKDKDNDIRHIILKPELKVRKSG